MNYELVKDEFIKLKKEELDYIDNTAKISSNKILSEHEKLEIYRTLKNYEIKLNKMLKRLWNEFPKDQELTRANWKDVIVEFEIDKNYLSSVDFGREQYKKHVLEKLGIDAETLKFKLVLGNLVRREEYAGIDANIIQNKQRLIETPIYIFAGYYDATEDCYGPCWGEYDDYLSAIYENICGNYLGRDRKEIPKKRMSEFEKDKIIIHSKGYVLSHEIQKIFAEELLNLKNVTLDDCINQTKKRIEELNYIRSPKYKEKVLLDRINELYNKVKGEFIQEEILYSGNFLSVLSETYKLSNENIVQKEKIIKNSGKNSVIVIALTQDKEYIITFPDIIKDKIIAEFPTIYIENDEDPLEAAKRELKEKTGYITDDLFIVDEAYTYPGVDNSVTYIVVANNCVKADDKNIYDTEFTNYGLFLENELTYLINKNIMNGATNKLAYYSMINNVDNCNVTYVKSNKKIYKTPKKKTNPLDIL